MVIILFLEPRFVKYTKTSVNVETYIRFMHSEPAVFFLLSLPLQVSTSAAHLSTGWNWTGFLLQNQTKKNTIGDWPLFLPLSHLVPIPLIFLRSVTEAKQRFPQENPSIQPFFLPSLSFWQPFLSFVFTPSPRRNRESCIFFNNFSHLISEAFNPKLQSSFLSSAPSPLKVLTI